MAALWCEHGVVHDPPNCGCPEKPLHVQVAEALGEPVIQHEWSYSDRDMCAGRCKQVWSQRRGDACAKHYDTDWSATGPLIEKYGIALWLDTDRIWHAISMPKGEAGHRDGATPLEAVCRLILALHEAGKLKAA